MKKCPFCAEEIQDEAIKCRHCGSMLSDTAKAHSITARPAVIPTAFAAQEVTETARGGISAATIIIGFGLAWIAGLGWFILASHSTQVLSTATRAPATTQAAKTPAPKQKTDPSVTQAVATFAKRGFLKRMDLKTGSFYVDGFLWESFELNDKQGLVRVLSEYRDGEYGLPVVTLYESKSGKELANFGVFSGVTIK